ncbi:metallophosphoesterase [Nocardioides sp. 1609]|uniref:metallophosphoesterase family protein n=1 Tax=Nocardioides sp. 1609 TaxID=2508327 RepID=UPI00106F472C|nr:metallophosphoesterase [Nocardioides sp. 1609]
MSLVPSELSLSRRAVVGAGAAAASVLALSPALRPAPAAARTARALSTARAGTLGLLTDPFLQAPTADGVSVVWMTEYAGAGHTLLVGSAVEALTDEQLVAAAGGSPVPGVRRFPADSFRLSRVVEDAASNVPVKPDTMVAREVHRHEAVASGLTERTPYRIVSTSGGEFAASGTFELAPAPKPGQGATILLTSDHQAMVNTPANLEVAKATLGRIDAVFLAGDLVNVPDRASEWFDDTRGSGFFPALQGRGGRVSTGGRSYAGGEIVQSAVLYPAIGNHEVQGRVDGLTALNLNNCVPREVAERRYAQVAATVNPTGDPAVEAQWIEDNSWSTTTYEEIFSLPEDSPGGKKYYATTVGDVRMISLFSTRIWRGTNANTLPAERTATSRYQESATTLGDPMAQGYGEFVFESLAAGSEQYEWLKEELASEEFQSAAITVVVLHEGPQGIGDNIMPVFAEPDRIETRDASGALTSVRYEYHPSDNMLLHDLQPLLEEAGTDLVLNGHSHLWNRYRSPGGTNWMETSNTGNTYGAFDGLSNRTRPLPPAPWNADNYLALGNPGGLEPILPSVKPFTNPDGVPLPFVQSNDLCVFTALDTATRTVTSWVYDVKQPDTAPWVIDEFTVGRGATVMTASATMTGTDGVRIAGTVRSGSAATGTVVVSAGGQELARARVEGGTFATTLPAGVLDVGTHAVSLVFPRTRTHLAASMSLAVTVPDPDAPVTPPTPAPGRAVVTASVLRVLRTRVRLAVRVQVPGGTAGGRVEIRRGNGDLVRRVRLRGGRATVDLPRRRLGAGQTTLRVVYPGSGSVQRAVGTVTFQLPRRS